MCTLLTKNANKIKPNTAIGSINLPFRFIGPRNNAYGRQTMASAAPRSSPVARVGVDR